MGGNGRHNVFDKESLCIKKGFFADARDNKEYMVVHKEFLKEGIKMLAKKKKGQSTVEYIILFTAVIVVILLFRQTFQNRMGNTLGNATSYINIMANRLQGGFKPAPAPVPVP